MEEYVARRFTEATSRNVRRKIERWEHARILLSPMSSLYGCHWGICLVWGCSDYEERICDKKYHARHERKQAAEIANEVIYEEERE